MDLRPDETMRCPLCKYVFTEQAKDFVVPGRIGLDSEAIEVCPECDSTLHARMTSAGKINVRVEP